MVGFGSGTLHVYPEAEGFGIYEENGMAFSQHDLEALQQHDATSNTTEHPTYVVVRNGEQVGVCEQGEYNIWAQKKAAGITEREPLKGEAAVLHDQSLETPGVEVHFETLARPSEGSDYLGIPFWRCGVAREIIEIAD